MTEIDSRLQLLLDKQDISECLLRFTRGIDRHDDELARSAFHADARDDHGLYIGSAHDMIDWTHAWHHSGLRGHQHYLTNMTIDVDGDEAHAESYLMLIEGNKNDWGHVAGGGRYLDRLERRDGVWRIVDKLVIFEWSSDPARLEWAAPLRYPFSQDRSDPSYRRPLQIDREDRDISDQISEFSRWKTEKAEAEACADRDPELQRLADEAEIRRVTCLHARAVDRFDWELMRSCYHPDAIEDHGAFSGPLDEFLEWVKPILEQWESTTHFLGNQLIDFEPGGDVAWVETSIWGRHRTAPTADKPAFDFFGNTRYFDRFERRDGEWRIAHRACIFGPGRVDPVLSVDYGDLRGGPTEDGPFAQRGPGDASYRRSVELKTA